MTTGVYHRRSRARAVLFGMRCAYTDVVLEALADAPSIDLRAVVLPEPASGAGRETPQANGIPLVDVADRSALALPGFRASLEATAPDVIVVACFPWRLPEWILALPTHGCLNVHPSLLPDGRGPEPVFWAFRWGLRETGITIHLMDAGFDTGPIVAQERVAIPGEATIGTLERTLARIGTELLIGCLPAIRDGSGIPCPQAGEPARYAPNPRPEDLVVPTTWAAHDAAHFVRAVGPTFGPVTVLVRATGQRLAVSEVISVDDAAAMPESVTLHGSTARVRFSHGVLTCRLVTRPQPIRLHHDAV